METTPRICMDPHARYGNPNLAQRAILRGPLTDKKLDRYIRMGYYSAAARQARKEWRQRALRVKRQGKFLEMEDGRLVFSPL